MKNILSVNELNLYLKNVLDNNETLQNVFVSGEISNLVFNKSGHAYFSLKDESASVSCAMWKTNVSKLRKINAKDGMKINVTGKIDYYVPYGRVSLIVNDVQIEGIGELQQIFEQRKVELENLGWFDKSRKRPLPLFPMNIGIVTADTGAAIHDLITTISRRWPAASIYLFPSKVQGEGASQDLAKRIVQANNFPIKLDVLIVGRGGGSYEDLWEFNEMPVLQALRNSKIPTISAIGHEPDITLSDYVADRRAATPTAAGEISTPNLQEVQKDIFYKYQTLKEKVIQVYKKSINDYQRIENLLVNQIQKIVDNKNYKLKNNFLNFQTLIERKLIVVDNQVNNFQKDFQKIMQQLFENNEQKIQNYSQKLVTNIKNTYNFNKNNLENQIKTVNLLNPLRPLRNGYALLEKNGKVLSSDDLIKVNDQLKIIRNYDQINSVVTSIEKRKEN